MEATVDLPFTMDPNLLVSVIKSQAGTLSKALLEGVMNSVDAGATRVNVTVDEKSFVIEDNGKGFSSEDEIKNWFGRFGTPHQEGDATFGRFRMGRGQMMAFASTTWRSGAFKMSVDLEKNGLRYGLTREESVLRGCRIEGTLYRELTSYRLDELLAELKKLVAFMPAPVHVNGTLYGAPAGRLKTWTSEDDLAWYRVVTDATELQVYNQGAFVEALPSWSVGFGGIVVSKKALEVNFARNSVMADSCPNWRQIRRRLEQLTMQKLGSSKKLSEDERRFMARRIDVLMEESPFLARKAKVLTDPYGRHCAFSDLRQFKRFVHISDQEALACAVHGTDGTFVVTDKLLTRFGCYDMDQWLRKMERIPGAIDQDYEVIDVSRVGDLGLGTAERLDSEGLTKKERAAFQTLVWLNEKLSQKLMAQNVCSHTRALEAGRHKKSAFVAWTDGDSHITVNKRYFKLFETGLDGVMNWLLTLVHEYMHDSDDSESHSHGDVFYRKFHDVVFMGNGMSLGSLAQEGLKEYLNRLRLEGVSRPQVLTRQLKAVA